MSNQVWESWRDDRLATLTQQRDELLRVLKYLSVEMAEQDEADDYAQWINTIETTIATVIGKRHTASQNDAPEYYTEGRAR